VAHDRDGAPERAIATVLLDDGRRAWADNSAPDAMAELTSGAEFIGRSVKITPDGSLAL
jgi:hypothetical protein